MKLYYAKSFNTKKGKYLYDSMMNLLYEIDGKFYDIINSENMELENKNYYDNYTRKYSIRNVTIPPEVKMAHDYDSQYMKNIAESHRKLLILSITNKCNLNCTYCIYHDKFSDISEPNYNHTMSFETATKAIDKLIEDAFNQDFIHVGFYGGECLLEFDLLKKCVEYVDNKSIGVIAHFGLTTNGLLLGDKKIRKYFENHDFQISVSLDGPQSINDRYRVTKDGKGSYGEVIKNLKLWYAENPKYVLSKISINSVMSPPLHIKAIDDFFSNSPIHYKSSPIDMASFFEANIYNDKNEYTDRILNRCDVVYSDKYSDAIIQSFKDYIPQESTFIPPMIIPGGPCIPIFLRWYVNSKGDYYPCERIPETEEFCIGNVDTDVDYEKVVLLYDNYINSAKSKCNGCWAIRLCGRCFKNINEDCGKLLDLIEERYIYYIENLKDDKKAMAVLESMSYTI